MKESLKSHLLNLYCMVVADGEISPKEKTELYRIGRDLYGVTEDEINKLIFTDDIVFYIPETLEDKILYLYDLALIAWADGKITDDERHLLSTYAKKFGVLKTETEELINFLLEKAQSKLSHEELLKEFSN
ncbi:MAG: TerB family tellurite resistance protein [Bacteroidales bacterium]|nr:TerB family tellurite resistance protein [Bacteroidales bacterium]